MSEDQGQLSEEQGLIEDGPDLSLEEAQLFEDQLDDLGEEVAEIEAQALADMEASVSVTSFAQDAEDDGIDAAASGYRVVDLRGKFGPAASAWGNRAKSAGVILHYNGGPAPARAWQYPIRWIRFIIGLHNAPGRFSPGWTFKGGAYHEYIFGRTVYRVRNYGADTPHCGNLHYNRNALGLHIPVGGSQRPQEVGDGTLVTAFERTRDHLRAMGHKTRAGCKGHKEVGSSLCPGARIQNAINSYRRGVNLGNGGEKPPGLVHRVIAGAFSSPVNAAKRERELQAKGFAAWSYEHEGVTRVQAGSFDSREKADDFVRQLSRAGFDAFIASENSGKA